MHLVMLPNLILICPSVKERRGKAEERDSPASELDRAGCSPSDVLLQLRGGLVAP